jgi:hypothetical protein
MLMLRIKEENEKLKEKTRLMKSQTEELRKMAKDWETIKRN